MHHVRKARLLVAVSEFSEYASGQLAVFLRKQPASVRKFLGEGNVIFDEEFSSQHDGAGARRPGVEGNCRALSEAGIAQQRVADSPHARAVCGALGVDGLERECFHLADAAVDGSGSRVSGENFHHFPRLRARLVF